MKFKIQITPKFRTKYAKDPNKFGYILAKKRELVSPVWMLYVVFYFLFFLRIGKMRCTNFMIIVGLLKQWREM